MTRPSQRAGARLLATGLAVGVCLLTAGCSPVYSPAGGIAQSASDAAAQAQTAAVALQLAARGRLLAPAAETALSDATERLGQDASSLTSADVSGGLSTARGRILARLRTGEDLLIQARRLVETQAGPSGSDAVVRRLQATSKALTALEQQLQASG